MPELSAPSEVLGKAEVYIVFKASLGYEGKKAREGKKRRQKGRKKAKKGNG